MVTRDAFLNIWEAGVYGYAAASTFCLVQLLFECVRLHGLQSFLAPSIFPFHASALTEVLMTITATLALCTAPPSHQDSWWSLFQVLSTLQIFAFLWTESASEWAFVLLAATLTEHWLPYAPCAWLAVSLVVVARADVSRDHLRSTAVALLQVAGWYVANHAPIWACVAFVLSAQLTIETLHLRTFGALPERYAGISNAKHIFLENVIGVRCVDAVAWHNHPSAAPTVLPPELRGARWWCDARVLRARRLHTSRTVGGDVQLPLAYWDEVAFAPSPMGTLACFVAGLRLPITTVARLETDATTGHVVLRQKAVVFLLWPLPTAVRFEQSLSPGGPCPGHSCVLVPTRLTMRRVTELLFTVFFVHHVLASVV